MKNKLTILGICLLTSTLSFAQVSMEINDGLLVETTGSLSIELSGNLIETNGGYLKGVVTSGDRGSGVISSFAGLALSSGVDQITRITGAGSELSTSSPKTASRRYEIESSSAISPNVTSTLLRSTPNDEDNGIESPYVFTKTGSTWKGFTDNGSTSSLITGKNVDISSSTTTNIVLAEGIGVGATILLEGPHTTGVAMSDALGTLPPASPYSTATEAPRTTTPPNGAVDWAMVELRSGTAANTSVGKRSAFINASGQLISDDGTVGIGFPAIPSGPSGYRLVIHHRNHLSVMSNSDIAYSWK